MKESYPRYGRFGLEKIYKTWPESEVEQVEQFVSYCAIGAAQRKLGDIRRNLIQFRDVVGKSFSEIDLQDLRRFLALLNGSNRKEYTRNGIKAHVRRFLKWRFKDWSQRFEEFRDVKLKNGFNEERINEGTLLTKEQIEAIVNRERDFVRKTFFLTLYESGLRPGELRTLKWKSVHLNTGEGISELHIFATKTSRARTVFVNGATPYLQKLFEAAQSDYVFPAVDNKDAPLPKATCHHWIKEMGAAAELDIFPYLLRHTRAHELYSKMPSKIAQKFMGHNSDMSELYAHISSQDIKDSILKTVYNLGDLPKETKHRLELEVADLRRALATICQNFPAIGRILAQDPSEQNVEEQIRKRRPSGTLDA
jgi:integrase